MADTAQEWTIIPEQEANQLVNAAGLSNALVGSWQPSVSDIAQPEGMLDQLLINECAQLSPGNRKVRAPLYYRQYAGLFRGNRRVLMLNGISKTRMAKGTNSPDWHSQAVVVTGGGQSFFTAVFDIERHRFEWFKFKGPLFGILPPAERWGPLSTDAGTK
jgi:hypothetical protein